MNTFFKIFLTSCILIILSSGIEVKAQKRSITSDFLVGFNFSELDIEGANRDKVPKLGMNIGMNLNFKVISNFHIQTGFFVSKKGLKQDISRSETDAVGITTINDTVWNYTGNYIQVPLALGFEVYLTEKFAFNVNAGLYAAYGYKGKSKRETTLTVVQDNIPSVADTKEEEFETYTPRRWRRFDYGAVGRVGLIYDVFTVNLSYEYGLYDINRQSPSLKNRNLTVALGFRF